MPEDSAAPTSRRTTKPPAEKSAEKPAEKPATADGAEAPATEKAPAPSSVSERAQEMRAGLAVRRDAEAMLAEASELRRKAASDADSMVTDAEAISAEIVGEARAEADRLVAAAQERADGIVARAQAEAERVREQVEAERQRAHAEVAAAVRADVEHAHDGLAAAGPPLEEALAALAGALDALQVVRDGDLTSGFELERVGPQTVADDVELDRDGSDEQVERITTLTDDAPPEAADDEARPLGWLFRANQG